MTSWIEILAIVPVLTSILLAYKYLITKRQGAKIASLFLQSEADKDLLRKQILQTIEDKKLVESGEFMSFLNNSREAAFSYIEDVQSEIAKFDKALYESLAEGTDSATTIKKILDANSKLQKLLPDNIKNNNVQGEL